jgi:hypothetical protein
MTAPHIFSHEKPTARKRVMALWGMKNDTQDMAGVMQVPQHETERLLHEAMELRRSVVIGVYGKP